MPRTGYLWLPDNQRMLCPYLVKQPYLVFALKNGKNWYGRNF
jgi:hypothetical protein